MLATTIRYNQLSFDTQDNLLIIFKNFLLELIHAFDSSLVWKSLSKNNSFNFFSVNKILEGLFYFHVFYRTNIQQQSNTLNLIKVF